MSLKLNINNYKITYDLVDVPFSHICRTCGICSKELSQIDNVCKDGIHLKDIIIKWTTLEFKDDDQLPRIMCKSCIKLMYQTYHFLLNCTKVQDILNDILKRSAMTSFEQVKELVDVFTEEELNINGVENLKITGILQEENVQINSEKSTIGDGKQQTKSTINQSDPPFRCGNCDGIFDDYTSLSKHRLEKKHMKSLKFLCPHCQKKSNTYLVHLEHIRIHTGEKPNKCPICGKGFNGLSDMRRHTYIHLKNKPYKCKFCDQSFTQKQYLRNHEMKHTGDKLICSFCGKNFVAYSSLKAHELIHTSTGTSSANGSSNSKPRSINRRFTCKLCNKELTSEHNLKEHTLLHGQKDFVCEFCSKTFITNKRLEHHISFAHQNPQFQCNMCGRTYKQRYCLEEHLKSHVGENFYDCSVCEKRFICKNSWRQHQRIHTGDTKFQCKECSRVFTNGKNLRGHMLLHTGEKPYNCEYCGKLFRNKSNLRTHIKLHTGDNNHICNICGKRYYIKRSLVKHIESMHTELDKFIN